MGDDHGRDQMLVMTRATADTPADELLHECTIWLTASLDAGYLANPSICHADETPPGRSGGELSDGHWHLAFQVHL